MQSILDDIHAQHDIYTITDLLSNALKKPVIIEDATFGLISYSSLYIHDFDQANQQTILSKKWPDTIHKCFLEEGIVEKLKMNIDPFRVERIKEIGLNQRIVVTARYKSEIMGYIWIQEIDRNLNVDELHMLKDVASHAAKVIFLKNQTKQAKEEELDLFYWNLIHNAYDNIKTIKWEADAVRVQLPKSMTIVVFKVTDPDEHKEWEEFETSTREYVKNARRHSYLLVDQSKMIVFLGTPSPESPQATPFEMVQEVLPSTNNVHVSKIMAGIGGEYGDMTSLRKSYLEALEVIKVAEFIGNQVGLPIEYHKLGIYRYLEAISTRNSEHHYVNEDLLNLKKKDIENQSELFKTLRVYLENNCKLRQTAEALFIHPNTLNYRIKQILEYLPIDFDNFNMKCQLYIDLILIENLEKKL